MSHSAKLIVFEGVSARWLGWFGEPEQPLNLPGVLCGTVCQLFELPFEAAFREAMHMAPPPPPDTEALESLLMWLEGFHGKSLSKAKDKFAMISDFFLAGEILDAAGELEIAQRIRERLLPQARSSTFQKVMTDYAQATFNGNDIREWEESARKRGPLALHALNGVKLLWRIEDHGMLESLFGMLEKLDKSWRDSLEESAKHLAGRDDTHSLILLWRLLYGARQTTDRRFKRCETALKKRLDAHTANLLKGGEDNLGALTEILGEQKTAELAEKYVREIWKDTGVQEGVEILRPFKGMAPDLYKVVGQRAIDQVEAMDRAEAELNAHRPDKIPDQMEAMQKAIEALGLRPDPRLEELEQRAREMQAGLRLIRETTETYEQLMRDKNWVAAWRLIEDFSLSTALIDLPAQKAKWRKEVERQCRQAVDAALEAGRVEVEGLLRATRLDEATARLARGVLSADLRDAVRVVLSGADAEQALLSELGRQLERARALAWVADREERLRIFLERGDFTAALALRETPILPSPHVDAAALTQRERQGMIVALEQAWNAALERGRHKVGELLEGNRLVSARGVLADGLAPRSWGEMAHALGWEPMRAAAVEDELRRRIEETRQALLERGRQWVDGDDLLSLYRFALPLREEVPELWGLVEQHCLAYRRLSIRQEGRSGVWYPLPEIALHREQPLTGIETGNLTLSRAALKIRIEQGHIRVRMDLPKERDKSKPIHSVHLELGKRREAVKPDQEYNLGDGGRIVLNEIFSFTCRLEDGLFCRLDFDPPPSDEVVRRRFGKTLEQCWPTWRQETRSFYYLGR